MKTYILEVMNNLGDKPEPLPTVCPESWKTVRDAMNNKKITPELENILFKIKVLYPCTVQYDELYEKKPKKEAVPKWDDSTAAMANKGLNSTSYPASKNSSTVQQTNSGFHMFDSIRGKQPSEKSKQLKTKKELEAIEERINNLNIQNADGNCYSIYKIGGLQGALKTLLSALKDGVAENSKDVTFLNDNINDLVNDISISPLRTSSNMDKNKTISDAQEIIETLQKDINTLGRSDLKKVLDCHPTAADNDTGVSIKGR